MQEKSPQGLTITANGGAVLQSTGAVKWGADSMYFDGNANGGSYIRTNVLPSIYNFATQDWTIEFWAYPTGLTSTHDGFISNPISVGSIVTGDNGGKIAMMFFAGTATSISNIVFRGYNGGNTPLWSITVTQSVPLNQWGHFAMQRSNGVFSLWYNGQCLGTDNQPTATLPAYNGAQYINLGTFPFGNAGFFYPFMGYLDDVRITLGVGRYPQSIAPAFEPALANDPYAPQVACAANFAGYNGETTSTELTGHSPLTFKSGAQLSSAQSRSGNTSLALTGSTGVTVGNSSGSSSLWNIASQDFTMEAWVYLNALPASGSYMPILSCQQSDGTGYVFGINNSAGTLQTGIWNNVARTTGLYGNPKSVKTGSWMHIAVGRHGDNGMAWLNGQLVIAGPPASLPFNINNSIVNAVIGQSTLADAVGLNGYIDDFRFTVGVCRYTGSFTPPQSSLTLVNDPLAASTTTLIHSDNGLVDQTNNLSFTSNGLTQPTSNHKYGNTAIYFAGQQTQSLQSQANPTGLNLATNNWTMEAWINPEGLITTGSDGNYYACIAAYAGTMSGSGLAAAENWQWILGGTSSAITKMIFNAYDASGNVTIATAVNMNIKLGVWQHIAVSRSLNLLYYYLDGTLMGTVSAATSGTNDANPITILNKAGSYLSIGKLQNSNFGLLYKGAIDDFRITNGVQRYPSFTVPNAAYSPGEGQFPFTWVTNSYQSTRPNTPISLQLSATIATGPTTTYSLSQGNLPSGFSLTNAGLLSGTTVNTFSKITDTFSVKAVSGPSYSEQQFTFVNTRGDLYGPYNTLNLKGDATPIVDSSPKAHTMTPTTGVVYSTTKYKYGGGSIFFPGTAGNMLTTEANPAGIAITGDFTIEAYVNLSNFVIQGANYVAMIYSVSINQPSGNTIANEQLSLFIIGSNATTPTTLQLNNGGTLLMNNAITTTNFALNTWHHVAISRTGSTMYMFLDGVLLKSQTVTTAFPLPTNANPAVQIGGNPSTGNTCPWSGYIDCLRVTNGVGRYTANFTPPSGIDFDDPPGSYPIVWDDVTTLNVYSKTVSHQILAHVDNGLPLTYSLASGSTLPTGWTLSSSGLISGTITGAQTYPLADSITVSITDGNQVSNFPLTINVINDPNFASVINLVTGRGTAGATPTDVTGKAVTLQGSGGLLSATQSKWGGGSIATSTNNFMYDAHAANPLPGDFTVEMWAWLSSSPAPSGSNMAFSSYPSGSLPDALFMITSGGAVTMYWNATTQATSANSVFPFNAWNHLAWTRSGSTSRIFVNGNQVLSFTSYTYNLGGGSGAKWGVGGYQTTPSANPWNGFFNDFRVTQGVARYTANFTPPTGPSPDFGS